MTQPCSGILTYNSQTAKNPNTELFKRIIRESGIKLMANDEANVLTQEQALVVRDMEKFLETEQSEDSVDKFLRGFRILIKKQKYLRKALLPTIFKKQGGEDGSENEMEVQQESLFRLFLKLNLLQDEIIEILLDELTSTVSEDEQDVPQLRLILNQLRYLPQIKNPQNLTHKLLDIIDVAPYPSQLEILDSIPEILPDSEYNETAKELTKMLDKNDELSGAIVDCLNALSLNSEIRAQIHDHILSKMLIGTSTKIFPLFLDFLMSDYNSRTLPGTLIKIRNALNVVMATHDKNDKDKESSKLLIFSRLQKSAVSKFVSETWLSVINGIKTHTDHKAVDLIILFMLHSSTKLKKRSIELTMRKKIKDGQFKCALLEQLFEKYFPQQLMRDYYASIIEIGSSLLRMSDSPVITDFASTIFKLLFTHEYTQQTDKQEILENMILLVGASDRKNVTAILNILVDLLDDISKAPNHAIILMKLLEKIDRFELNDVRLVFEILCRLTCSEECLQGLKEEIHMLIRKQLSSAKRSFKFRGVISAVVMAKHVAMTAEEESDGVLSEDSVITMNHLQGGAKEAAAILELTSSCIVGSPELVGLYYDQLAAMLMKGTELDKYFLAWLHETVTADFQSTYVTETVCDDINGLRFSMQYGLNSAQEMDTPFAVNIAELALKPGSSAIFVLAPHFRLLRLLHFLQQNGDLSSIDALLGCSVVLPDLEQRDNLSIEQTKQMTDCLFHCINWFRETISGFVTQKSRRMRQKVIQRVGNLQELQTIFFECLENVPNHKLPPSYFDDYNQLNQKSSSPIKEPNKPGKAPRKKLKSKTMVEDTSTATVSKPPPKRTKEEKQQVSFREMDTDVVILLKYPLKTEEITPTDQNKIQLSEFNFIMKDFVTKLTLLTQRHDLGLSHLNMVAPLELMKDCPNILLNINKHFVAILKKLDQTQEEDTDDAKNAKITFGLTVETLSLIFSWPGFQHSQRIDLLRDILKAFRPQETSCPLNSVNNLVIDLVDRLSEYTDYCTCLAHAVDLIKALEALHALAPGQGIRSKIAKTGNKLLNKEWKVQNSVNVDILIKSYLSSANIKTLCGMVGTIQEQAPELATKTDSLEMLKSITKTNFYILYRNLWICLYERVKTEIQSLTNAQHLTLWRMTSLTMQGLMTIAKAQETKLNLICFLKQSIAILKIFLSHGIPILEIELKNEPDRVVEIFKTIQSNTRFLHHLCCYSKLMKDASLMSYVPQFRLTLETLVYRVKAALVANGCSSAFWMGNLKNRDLQGEDILSQSTENSTQNTVEECEDEPIPSDDNLEEDESEDAGSNHSGSEVFQ